MSAKETPSMTPVALSLITVAVHTPPKKIDSKTYYMHMNKTHFCIVSNCVNILKTFIYFSITVGIEYYINFRCMT